MNHSIAVRASLLLPAAAYCLVSTGCSGRPSRVVAPAIDAQQAAALAVQQCDADQDGALTTAELKKCPAILASLGKYDADGNGQVTAEEIQNRIASWSKSGVGITTQTFFVFLDGRPLADARVELAPEPFFGDLLFPAESSVSGAGMCSPSLASDQLPEGVPTGIYCGLYRVKITHPAKQIPAHYNEASELGIEICPDYDFYNPVKFKLKSK